MTEQEAPARRGRRRGFRLAGTGIWAVTDQALFSGSNFVMNVMLARWLGQTDYGVFSLAYSVLLFLGTAHTAFITEPMLVFGSSRFGHRFGSYLRVILRHHWILMGVVSIVPALVGVGLLVTRGGEAAATLVACAASAPFILLPWMLRKACYVHLQPRFAAYAGGIYLVLMLAGLAGLRYLGWLNPVTAFVLLAVASVGSVGILMRHLFGIPDEVRDPATTPAAEGDDADQPFSRYVALEHWRYGRWGIGAVFLNWFSNDIYYIGIAAFHGFEATGALRAAMNLILPAKQTFVALGTVALPMLVSARSKGQLKRTSLLTLALFLGAAALYAILLAAFRRPLVDLLYGSGYEEVVPTVLILSTLPLFIAVARALKSTLHAMERPRGVFNASLPGGIFSIVVGMYLTWQFSTIGASVGLVLGAVAGSVALVYILTRRSVS